MSIQTNTMTISGNMVKDIEFKTTQTGKLLGTGTIACLLFKGKNGRDDDITFLDFNIWDKYAETVQFLNVKKGMYAVLTGYLKQHRWTDSSTNVPRTRYTLEINTFSLPGKSQQYPQEGDDSYGSSREVQNNQQQEATNSGAQEDAPW